jgi:hypothetical protein
MSPPIRTDDLNEFPPLRKSMNNVMLTPLNTDWIPDHVFPLAPIEETSNCSPIMLDDMNEFPSLPTSVGNTVSSILQNPSYQLDNKSSRQIGGGLQCISSDATSPLDSNVVINILLKPDQDKINEYPPAKPRGGEVFLVQSAKQDDWKCDQLIWINDSKSTPKCSENGVKLI